MRIKNNKTILLLTSCIVVLSLSSFSFNKSEDKGNVSLNKLANCTQKRSAMFAFGQSRWGRANQQHVQNTEQIKALFQKDWSDYNLKTVVIDAGHGGVDAGTSSKDGVLEKNVVLSISKQLGAYISTYYPSVKVVYTRTEDVFLKLRQRAKIANDNKADLFISIHCNSFKKSYVRGLETYVMGLSKTAVNLAIMKRENDVVLLEDDYKENYEEYGVDSSSPLYEILMNSYQNAHLEQSLAFASTVEQQFKKTGMKTRGVHQAGFAVLLRTTMPSVLVETGYLSNNTDKLILNSKKGQHKIAKNLFYAFEKYKKGVDNMASNDVTNPYTVPSSETAYTSSSLKEVNKGFQFVIQLASSQTLLDTKASKWKSIRPDMFIEKADDGWLRYMLKGFGDNFDKAEQKLNKLKHIGFSSCFIVAYLNGQRVDLLWAKQQVD